MSSPSSAAPTARILVVDQPLICEAISVALESGGHLVVGASTEEEALAAARGESFDLLFLDRTLDDRAAAEVASAVRRRRPRASLVMLCSHDLPGEERHALRVGADALLCKPLVPDQVRAHLSHALERQQATPEPAPSAPHVLIVDDDLLVLESVRDCLEGVFPVTATSSPFEALRLLKQRPAEILVTDLMMSELSGVDLIRSARSFRPLLKAIVVTGYGSKEAAISAMREGAYEFLEKPLMPSLVVGAVERAWRLVQVELENQRLLEELQNTNEGLRHEMQERRRLELELIQAQKLKAIGQLASGIAHEINTPVQFITNNMLFLKDAAEQMTAALGACRAELQTSRSFLPVESQRRLDQVLQRLSLGYPDEELSAAVQESLLGLERVNGIVSAMRDFAHPGTGEKVHINLNEVITNMVTVSRGEWKYVAELELRLGNLPLVPCLPGPINQALLNIIVNAAQAVTAGGARDSRQGLISIQSLRDGEWAEVRVTDNGPGIAEEIQARVFEPFFTTKPIGSGTGQGLAIAHTVVVNQHGGRLWFESKPGRGTTFFVELPLGESAERREERADD